MKAIFFIGAAILSLYLIWREPGIPRPDGVLAPDEPYQKELYIPSIREQNGYRIAPLASFEIRARVIASTRYRFARGADLAPVDPVLGWGAMSDNKVLEQIHISQGGRAYTWWTKAYPVSRQVIESHSANMHMIPGDAEIDRHLKGIRPGNMVHLKGLLVEVTSKEGWRWKSSLTRNDTGGGACELLLVESLFAW